MYEDPERCVSANQDFQDFCFLVGKMQVDEEFVFIKGYHKGNHMKIKHIKQGYSISFIRGPHY